jgi:UDP-N-acetylglucosamine--N-acetylmuramyl-(pentapeptide) pyrophosphoryl-undecaprenol N-acetylglucosamine transferase
MSGKDDYRRVRDACERAGITATVLPFVENMVAAYTAADLMVSRAGASTLAEMCAVGVPAILVPYPHAADRHQELNARALVSAGAAEMILNGDLQGSVLAERITALAEDSTALESMRDRSRECGKPDAAERVVNLLFEMVFA